MNHHLNINPVLLKTPTRGIIGCMYQHLLPNWRAKFKFNSTQLISLLAGSNKWNAQIFKRLQTDFQKYNKVGLRKFYDTFWTPNTAPDSCYPTPIQLLKEDAWSSIKSSVVSFHFICLMASKPSRLILTIAPSWCSVLIDWLVA